MGFHGLWLPVLLCLWRSLAGTGRRQEDEVQVLFSYEVILVCLWPSVKVTASFEVTLCHLTSRIH